MNNINIQDYGVAFKNIVSAPAPAGRILNYIKLAGNGNLYHRNGNRDIKLVNNVGSAWATEFMIGLGLIYVEGGEDTNSRKKVFLTKDGIKIYNLIKSTDIIYIEQSTSKALKDLKEQMEQTNEDLYNTFLNVFISSPPFALLSHYLVKTGFNYSGRKQFMNDYYSFLQIIYNVSENTMHNDKRTSTGDNRVPSTLQLMALFGFLDDKNFVFDSQLITSSLFNIKSREFSYDELLEEAKNLELYEDKVSDLTDKYGVDGNVLVTQLVRNSSLQSKFRNNLIRKYQKCLLCQVDLDTILIASHIKPSVDSDVNEKADINNGFLLCSNHDRLFDTHLISFDTASGQITLSKTLTDRDIINLNIPKQFIIPHTYYNDNVKKYMSIHFEKFLEKEDTR